MAPTFTKENLLAALQDQDCTEALFAFLNAAAKHPTCVKLIESDDQESSSDDGAIREIGIQDGLITGAWVQNVCPAYKVYRGLDKAEREGSTKREHGQNSHQVQENVSQRKRQTAIKSRSGEYGESEEPEMQEAAPT
jgi:hypothetical protein